MKFVSAGDDPQMLKFIRGQSTCTVSTVTRTMTSTCRSSLSFSPDLAILELLQADGTDGARVGAAGRAPGPAVVLRARAALRAVGFGLESADGPHGLLVDRVL